MIELKADSIIMAIETRTVAIEVKDVAACTKLSEPPGLDAHLLAPRTL